MFKKAAAFQRFFAIASFASVASLASFAAPPAARAETVIKFATLAPEGSTWMKAMHELADEVAAKTNGEVKFRFYAGGVSGDERDILRKVRIGQLHAAGVTGLGLGMVVPPVRVLDSPFLIATPEESDLILKRFDKEFRKLFDENGFILLGWAEVGFIYVFSGSPVRNVEDLRSLKMWMWEGDPIAESLFKALRVSPIPLAVTDVRTALQTGLVNGVYGSPMSVIAMQWFPKTPYRHSMPCTYASGAVLLSKKVFDSLPDPQQKALINISQKHLRRLTESIRGENQQALKTLEAQGIKTIEPSSLDVLTTYREAGIRARRDLVDILYPQSLLDRVEKTLEEYRSKNGPSSPKRH